jgi:radical SAM superfamily enzyme YgiQ (UPF0313 family)
MKVLLIMADANMHKFWLFGRIKSAREAPLTLTTLAAIGTAVPDIEFRLVDESVDQVPLDYPADLVAISVLTGTSRRAYALATHFRSRGIPVVLGGIHVSILPDEAAKYADSIVIGMAEQTWPRLLRDFKAGQMAAVYREEPPEGDFACGIPTPRYDLQRNSGYMMPYTVMATRGCVHTCDFCTVPVVWKRFLRRPVADIVRDIKAIPSRRFAINDVSPFDDVDYAKELLQALIPLKKKWGGLATTRITSDPELMDLLVRSGCQYLLLGFESISQRSLNKIYKGFNTQEDYGEVMYRLHKAGIVVQGCFVFGFDEDDKDIFAATVAEIQRLKIDIPRYSLYTPYPGTPLFERLQVEGRILTCDWGSYDTMHVVIQPKKMTPVELYEGFRWAYRETFRWGNIFHRTIARGTRFPIILVGNMTYRHFVHKIHMAKGFEQPLGTFNEMLAEGPDRRDAMSQRPPASQSRGQVLLA